MGSHKGKGLLSQLVVFASVNLWAHQSLYIWWKIEVGPLSTYSHKPDELENVKREKKTQL